MNELDEWYEELIRKKIVFRKSMINEKKKAKENLSSGFHLEKNQTR